MDGVTPGNPPPHVVVFALALARIEAADLAEEAPANHDSGWLRPPVLVTQGLRMGPAFEEAGLTCGFAAIGKKLDIVAADHIGAGSLGFSDLSFKFVRKPQIVIVQKGDPFTRRTFD